MLAEPHGDRHPGDPELGRDVRLGQSATDVHLTEEVGDLASGPECDELLRVGGVWGIAHLALHDAQCVARCQA